MKLENLFKRLLFNLCLVLYICSHISRFPGLNTSFLAYLRCNKRTEMSFKRAEFDWFLVQNTGWRMKERWTKKHKLEYWEAASVTCVPYFFSLLLPVGLEDSYSKLSSAISKNSTTNINTLSIWGGTHTVNRGESINKALNRKKDVNKTKIVLKYILQENTILSTFMFNSTYYFSVVICEFYFWENCLYYFFFQHVMVFVRGWNGFWVCLTNHKKCEDVPPHWLWLCL